MKNIQLIMYTHPLFSDPAQINTIMDFAAENNIVYLPLAKSEYIQLMNFDSARNYSDGVHTNIRGAEKITELLGILLDQMVDIPDRRGNKRYDFLAKEYNYYVPAVENHKLHLADNTLEEYLTLLNNPRYTLFITVRDQSCNLSEAAQTGLLNLGLTQPIIGTDRYRFSYLAVISNGKVKQEQISDTNGQLLTYEGRLSGGEDFIINSQGAGKDGLGVASVLINDKEYAVNSRGLNIVVYDNDKQNVIDSIAFDTHSDSSARR